MEDSKFDFLSQKFGVEQTKRSIIQNQIILITRWLIDVYCLPSKSMGIFTFELNLITSHMENTGK